MKNSAIENFLVTLYNSNKVDEEIKIENFLVTQYNSNKVDEEMKKSDDSISPFY